MSATLWETMQEQLDAISARRRLVEREREAARGVMIATGQELSQLAGDEARLRLALRRPT